MCMRFSRRCIGVCISRLCCGQFGAVVATEKRREVREGDAWGCRCASTLEGSMKNEGAGMRRWHMLRTRCHSFPIMHA